MILQRITQHVREQNWFVMVIEILIVVVGILLALQVDQWAQGRADRALERDYLHRLVEDLETEQERMVVSARSTQRRLEGIRMLDAYVQDPPAAAAAPFTVPWAIETVSWSSFPQVNGFVFRELQSTGRLMLIRSVPLRRALAEHYTEIEHDARVGDDRTVQRRFEAATAGIATIDELIAVEQNGRLETTEIEAARAVAMVEALAARPEALAELPGLAQHHVFNIEAIEDMQARTDALIEQIRRLLAQRGTDG